MQITNLKLLNFRNYDRLDLSFSKNNIIYGLNGIGKTNLVEAIYVLALTKTFRSSNDKIVIKSDKELTKIKGIISDDIKNEYEVIIRNSGKSVKINGNSYHKLSDYISNIKVILFSPSDLQIIKDAPSIRRKLINISISQIDNNYLNLLSNYNKVLKQRNSYLKTMYLNANTSSEYLDVLTDKLIDLGLKIHKYRLDYINEMNTLMKSIYKNITDMDNFNVSYISDYTNLSLEDIKKIYKKNKEKDMLLGMTKVGVHHDDILFTLNEKDLKEYGSQGQQKNAIISYKLAEIQVINDRLNKLPILILDDLFSELDVEKINNILGMIDKNIQTFITTTEIDKVNESIIKNSKVFHIMDNTIEEG